MWSFVTGFSHEACAGKIPHRWGTHPSFVPCYCQIPVCGLETPHFIYPFIGLFAADSTNAAVDRYRSFRVDVYMFILPGCTGADLLRIG